MSFSFPLMLDVRDRVVVIFGGGGVAVRKARALLDAGATRVTAVSPQFSDDMPAAVQRKLGVYDASHLEGVELAFAATSDSEVNDQIVRDCTARRILVNRADTDETLPGDFATPAKLRHGPITVTVSAGSAALTAAIRDGIDAHWNPAWTQMASAMRDLRPIVLGANGLAPDDRSEILRLCASPAAFERLADQGVEGLTAWVHAFIEERRKG